MNEPRNMNPASRMSRRSALAILGALLVPAAAARAAASTAKTAIEVWKDPQCGCCQDWVAHLEANGFQVKVNDSGNNAARARLGIARQHGSCHTAQVGGYGIEGHVPASEIRKLLAQKPAAIGLAVPGMPIGSPGMDGPAYGGRKQAYDVLLLARDGSASVYRRYEGNETAAR